MASQLGNTVNTSMPAFGQAFASEDEAMAPSVPVGTDANGEAPVRQINAGVLRNLGMKYKLLFDRYASERLPVEQKWLKNLRQYMGIYDPEIERMLAKGTSRAYPRLTRMKCIAMLSRLMNLMFPGNEDNWELSASPSPEMSPEDVAAAVNALLADLTGPDGAAPPLTQELIDEAVRALADKRAAGLSRLIKDQLLELGGDQTIDWIALNRKVTDSGIKYGIGVLEGPYIRKIQQSGWMQAGDGGFQPVTRDIYKPQYEHLPVWDFYPDMSARDLPGEGYFVRKVMGRAKLRKLADRPGFFAQQIRQVITQMPGGNFKMRSFETELRAMGTAAHAETTSNRASGRDKYEVIIWKGPVSAQALQECGAVVPEGLQADDIDAEIWMVDNWIIKAAMNPWRQLGLDLKGVHIFSFDDDDTSPVSQGLPAVVRDSQMSICAATRMTLDNASITCAPNLEVNTSLMRADQDLTSIQPNKIWYREDEGLTAQFPAVRELKFDGHLNELQSLIRLFLDFAEMETFIGPQTGGDMAKMPSEPMRTAAGASMLRGDAALPFKDIVRNYDSFTQSVIWSLVGFNKVYNPDAAPAGDYDVIARGATSLIAKEVRGMQIDMLSQTLTPEERDHIDDRKFIEAKFAARDMQGMLVSEDQAKRNAQARAQAAAQQQELNNRMADAQIRETNASAFNKTAQGQKNAANADSVGVKTALEMINAGEPDADEGTGNGSAKTGAGSRAAA